MIRSQRRIAPVLALLGFEVAAIVGLQAIGSTPSMQVPWGDLSTWVHTSSVDEIAAPLIRLFALVVAYWMFVSTALCMIAQASRIPAAVRATNMFTLPTVRRMVDGAMAVSIVTTSFVGVTGTAAFAGDASTSVGATVDGTAGAPGDDGSTATTVPADDDGPVPSLPPDRICFGNGLGLVCPAN